MKKKMVSWCLLSMLISILNLAFTFLVSIYLCIFLSTGLLVLTLMLRAKKNGSKDANSPKGGSKKNVYNANAIFLYPFNCCCLYQHAIYLARQFLLWYRTHRIWHLPYSL